MEDNDDDRDDFTGRKRFNRQRADLKKLSPHELKESNPYVVGGVIFVLLAVMIGGWYLMHHLEEHRGKPQQQAEEQKESPKDQ